MTSRLKSLYVRFASSTRGVAGIEFGLILPILVLLLLAFFNATATTAIYTRTRFATATLAQITNQYNSTSAPIHDADMTAILGATSQCWRPMKMPAARTSQIAIAHPASHGELEHQPRARLYVPASHSPGDSEQLLDLRHQSARSRPHSPTVSGPITPDSIYVSPRNSVDCARVAVAQVESNVGSSSAEPVDRGTLHSAAPATATSR